MRPGGDAARGLLWFYVCMDVENDSINVRFECVLRCIYCMLCLASIGPVSTVTVRGVAYGALSWVLLLKAALCDHW